MTDDEIGTLWAERNALEAIVTTLRAECDALKAEVQRLRALVESAYMEGAMANWDGHGVPAEYLPKDWAKSDARRALEGKPWKHIEPRESFEIEWTILP